ncbi:hypothetical protein [Mycolicibacterium sp.]|uniref:hypothetical protein n=1 Tax=Mycolicibacterium sp. TaxID=2320850 RepID=UPI003D0A0503
MSKKSEAKKARRKKRRAARDADWVPDAVAAQLEIAAALEYFDEHLTERGWTFHDDPDEGVFWVWPDSVADVDHEAQRADATVVMLSPDDDGEIAHVVFVGTAVDHQFYHDELFESLDVIEAYRIGDPLPVFD